MQTKEQAFKKLARTDKVMEDFFQSFRDAGIASVGLKAAITPTNQLDLKTLYVDLLT